MSSKLSLIIVTHNSEPFINRCVTSIDSQNVAADQVVIVDSGSDDPSYLDEFQGKPFFQVQRRENIGFAAASNYGLGCVNNDPLYILFINPDIILESDSIERSIATLRQHQAAAIVSVILRGYDFTNDRATGLLDSTGIFRTCYGRWYDR
ncbi:MAG: glycosyltransferase, partial [Desulfofustis sp.]